METQKKKKHECQICGKTFTTSQSKNRHIRIHTGEKPYSCEICEKSFSQLIHKDTHMKTHLQKTYSCDVCSLSFSDLASRNKHMRAHFGEKPYSCDICGKSFSDLKTKVKHMRTHTGEKPYSCEICCKSFSQKGNKDRHMKKHTTGKKLDTSDKCSKSLLDVNKHKTVHKYNYNGLLSTMKPVCVKLRKLSPLEIKSLSEINNEHSLDSISEEETLNKDPLTIQIDGTITTVVEETKEKDLDHINTRCEISDNNIDISDNNINIDDNDIVNSVFKEDDKTNISQVKTENAEIEVEEEDLVKKYWEEFTSDLPQTKEEETLANDSLSIKEEPAFIDKADADVNVKEEETGDYLYDSDNIDHSEVYKIINEIDIEDFKLEDPDV